MINTKQKRANRRKQEAKKKSKIKKIIKNKNSLNKKLIEDKKFIGKLVSTHGASCSCFMCGNPRKYFKEKTLQEKINDENFIHQKTED
jgi:hypothetical protein